MGRSQDTDTESVAVLAALEDHAWPWIVLEVVGVMMLAAFGLLWRRALTGPRPDLVRRFRTSTWAMASWIALIAARLIFRAY
jgi:hypothetical protein